MKMSGGSMKRAMMLTLLATAGCVSQSTTKEADDVQLRQRPPRPFQSRKMVAVVDFVDKTVYGQGRLGTVASDVLITGLLEGEQVRVIERQQLSKLLDEQKLQHSGVTDQSSAVDVGKLANADYLVY